MNTDSFDSLLTVYTTTQSLAKPLCLVFFHPQSFSHTVCHYSFTVHMMSSPVSTGHVLHG